MDFFYQQKNYKYLYFLIGLVYILGLWIPLMENDSAQHATMAMRMCLENTFELFRAKNAYLDKPHMHFWLSALSFKIFGINQFAYRFPALLFTVLGAFSCFKLTKKLYSKEVAHFGAFIFLTSQSIILANHDVRTDAILTGATIFAIWQLFEYVSTKKLLHIFLGAIGMGISFSTKGFYGVAIICFSLFSYITYERKFNTLFSYKILVGFLIFSISISPVLCAYYLQFGIEGVEFILWNQNVKRASGGMGTASPDYFFFFHSLLWVFLPWAFLMYFGLYYQVKKIIKNKFKLTKNVEVLTIGGFIITILVISFSTFKLPHYLNPLLPILSVFTAGVLFNLKEDKQTKTLKFFMGFTYFNVIALSITGVFILFFPFGLPSTLSIILSIIGLLILMISIRYKEVLHKKIVIISVLLMIFVNFVLNSHFYPNLLQFQGGSNLAKLVDKEDIDNIYLYGDNNLWSLSFYLKHNLPYISHANLKKNNTKTWICARKHEIDTIKKDFIILEEKKSKHFRITRLNGKFLNPKKREKQLDSVYLLKVIPKD